MFRSLAYPPRCPLLHSALFQKGVVVDAALHVRGVAWT